MKRTVIVAIAVSIVLVAGGAWALLPAVELARLQHDDQHLMKINAKLDMLNQKFSAPPDADKPAFQAVLADIILQANMAVATAQQIQNKVR